ncbi:MAG: hypothetical protein SFW67_21360 [Myxococcaceae bacterium]|nr:hypothetical protein [Myxococcaceae bacterium]
MSGHGVWARVGYELASPAPMFYSLSGETDFRRVVTLVPLVSFASESVLGIIPSFSAGAGFPIDLLDGPARLGLRGQLGLQWPYVGVVGGLDVMSGTSSLLLRGFVMLQVGL